MSGRGDVLLARGDLPGARKEYEEALKICEEIKDEDFTAQIHTTMAYIALIEGRFADGEALARQTAAIFDKANSTASSAWAHSILARNLLSEGKLKEAETAGAQAVALARQAAGQAPRFEAALADARVQAKLGKTADARRQLETTIATARKFGYRLYELQARLALAEVELWSGSPSARPHLETLEADAKVPGALLVANQARTLRQTK
jgi:tetratricopeptide (TPR) repeat protein